MLFLNANTIFTVPTVIAVLVKCNITFHEALDQFPYLNHFVNSVKCKQVILRRRHTGQTLQ